MNTTLGIPLVASSKIGEVQGCDLEFISRTCRHHGSISLGRYNESDQKRGDLRQGTGA
jgi:hypothetical protein